MKTKEDITKEDIKKEAAHIYPQVIYSNASINWMLDKYAFQFKMSEELHSFLIRLIDDHYHNHAVQIIGDSKWTEIMKFKSELEELETK